MTEDDFKGAIHAAMGGILAIMCGYNLMRLCATKRGRFKFNVGIYVPLMLFEGYQTWFHWCGTGVRSEDGAVKCGPRNTGTPPDESRSRVEVP